MRFEKRNRDDNMTPSLPYVMFDSESLFESEPNAFDGESSDNWQETDSKHSALRGPRLCLPSRGDTRVLDQHVSYHSEASISGRGEAAAESSSRLVVTLVQQGNPRVPMRPPKELLFGVDYLDPNKITKES
ncbi:hypothetical protein L3X38_036386 [Prunus dulcis]|uniref:Uncharacterized protein n=1 Tax=Prunus dulcis TaxID=3755 RepID=A0AAD4V1D6_PRUDU|nr:hypothetical protein L3X38_036386 [Prunus dulcis]